MTVTIATHCGHQVARQHNRRNPKVTDKEGHIRKDGDHAVWVDIDPMEAYKQLFGSAVAEYNEQQSRADRQIKDYYNHVKKDAKKHPVYEVIVGVYPKDGELTEQQQKYLLNLYAQGWAKANPHLWMCGCYWHADEAGHCHIHVDYIPWAEGYKNGPSRQAGLVKALEQQGFKKQGRETAQMQWTRAENARLEAICRAHGLEVIHPQRGMESKHMATKDYKFHKGQLEALRSQIQSETLSMDKAQKQASEASERLLRLQIQEGKKRQKLEQQDAQLDQLAQELRRAVRTVDQFKNAEDVFQWMENAHNTSGHTMLEMYCDSQNLDYEYWVEHTNITPNPYGSYGYRTQ